MSLSLFKSQYSLDWTVFYWAWYIALAPAVGAFIVNISNNKTIRELIFGALIVGSLGCIFHIGVLSNISIYFYENGILDAPKIYADESLTSHALVIETVSSLNYGTLFLILFTIIAVVFLCTTYDSLSYILAAASMKNFKDMPSRSLRVFFAIILMIQPALIMFLGGKDSFMWLLVVISVPLMIIYLFLILSYFKNAIKFKNHRANIFEKNPFDVNKTSIIFVIGAGMDHRIILMFNLENLYNQFNILGIDLPGHGYTSGPIVDSIRDHTHFCIDVFNEIGIKKPIVIGHSWGGLVALDLATEFENEMTICMNIAYPFLVGDMLLDYAKGNLDQAVEFLMKYGIYKFPKTEIKTKGFGTMGSGFYGRSKEKLNHLMEQKLLKMTQKERLSYIL